MCYVSLTIGKKRVGSTTNVCAREEDRNKVVGVARQAGNDNNYVLMAACIKRAIQLNKDLDDEEKLIFQKAYEGLVKQLYKEWVDAHGSDQQRNEVQLKLNDELDDMFGVLKNYLLPSPNKSMSHLGINLEVMLKEIVEIVVDSRIV